MRRALATAGLFGAITFGALTVTTAPALAAGQPTVATGVVVAQDDDDLVDVDVDEDAVDPELDEVDPNLDEVVDGDDTGKWGLAGLAGLFGLFGYKKYRDHRAATRRDAGPNSGSTARP